jgi:hypothetical protein
MLERKSYDKQLITVITSDKFSLTKPHKHMYIVYKVRLFVLSSFVLLSAEPIAECRVKVTRRQKDVNNSLNKVSCVLCHILILFWSVINFVSKKKNTEVHILKSVNLNDLNLRRYILAMLVLRS